MRSIFISWFALNAYVCMCECVYAIVSSIFVWKSTLVCTTCIKMLEHQHASLWALPKCKQVKAPTTCDALNILRRYIDDILSFLNVLIMCFGWQVVVVVRRYDDVSTIHIICFSMAHRLACVHARVLITRKERKRLFLFLFDRLHILKWPGKFFYRSLSLYSSINNASISQSILKRENHTAIFVTKHDKPSRICFCYSNTSSVFTFNRLLSFASTFGKSSFNCLLLWNLPIFFWRFSLFSSSACSCCLFHFYFVSFPFHSIILWQFYTYEMRNKSVWIRIFIFGILITFLQNLVDGEFNKTKTYAWRLT